jgi:zinc transporter ZupT
MTYLLPFLAVFIGFLLSGWITFKKQGNLKLLLAFSGAFLLALTLFELLPKVYVTDSPKTVGVFIILGILIQIFLEFFSKGAEHGHVHMQEASARFPLALTLSLCIHSFIEGLPLQDHGSLVYGIMIHKIPVAFILGVYLRSANVGMPRMLAFMLLFAGMTPLGSFVAHEAPFLLQFKNQITALTIGVFLHISTIILFESSEGHSFNLQKLVVILLGMGTAYLL